MDIKKAASTPLSIEQASSTEQTTASQNKINAGISSNTKDSYENSVNDAARAGGAVDPNALVQHVLRESYLQTTEDLKYYADKVKHFNEQKKEVRDYVENLKNAGADLKTELSAWQPGQKSNVMETVAAVIKDSLKDTSEDKKYYLNVLASMNKTSDALSEMMQQITDASSDLATKEKDDDD